MAWISVKWLLIRACASMWTIVFSMFSTPRVRGWRNLGWPACFIVGVTMLFVLPWRWALVTWAVAGVFSGLVYFGYESVAFLRARDKTKAATPNPLPIAHGLFLWPIMLSKAIEYFLADVGVLKTRAAVGGPDDKYAAAGSVSPSVRPLPHHARFTGNSCGHLRPSPPRSGRA